MVCVRSNCYVEDEGEEQQGEGASQAIISLNVNEILFSLYIITSSIVSINSLDILCLYLYLASPVKIADDLRAFVLSLDSIRSPVFCVMKKKKRALTQ